MAHYIDADKLKAEIDRRYEEYMAKFKTQGDSYHLGICDGLDMAERVLDTLEEQDRPEPYNPTYDEAYLNEKIKKASKTWKGVDVDKYMNEVRGREPEVDLEEEADRMFFSLGWISVKDRLPMQDEEVIVLTDKLGIAPMYEISFGHIVDKERCIDYDGWNVPGVEYWMSCPEIPED